VKQGNENSTQNEYLTRAHTLDLYTYSRPTMHLYPLLTERGVQYTWPAPVPTCCCPMAVCL